MDLENKGQGFSESDNEEVEDNLKAADFFESLLKETRGQPRAPSTHQHSTSTTTTLTHTHTQSMVYLGHEEMHRPSHVCPMGAVVIRAVLVPVLHGQQKIPQLAHVYGQEPRERKRNSGRNEGNKDTS